MYQIFHKGLLIGHSKLEMGDPPMGVAYGEFLPSKHFSSIKFQFEHIEKDCWILYELLLKTKQGKPIKAHAGTAILAYESLESPFYLEFQALGIDSKIYESLFPHHVKIYNEQFNN